MIAARTQANDRRGRLGLDLVVVRLVGLESDRFGRHVGRGRGVGNYQGRTLATTLIVLVVLGLLGLFVGQQFAVASVCPYLRAGLSQ